MAAGVARAMGDTAYQRSKFKEQLGMQVPHKLPADGENPKVFFTIDFYCLSSCCSLTMS